MTTLNSIRNVGQTAIVLKGNLTDAAFVPVNPANPGATIAAKDKISTINIEQQSATQALATPEISNRLAPADEYAKDVMTMSGQYRNLSELPPNQTPAIDPAQPGAESLEKTDLIPGSDKNIVEPKSYTMAIIMIIIIIALAVLLFKSK